MKLDLTEEEYKKRILDKIIEITEQDKAHILTSRTVRNMAESLVKFNFFSVQKFIDGQKKHGGNITDRHLPHELRMEHYDMFWYFEAEGWPR